GKVEPNAMGATFEALPKSEADKEKREQGSRTPNVDKGTDLKRFFFGWLLSKRKIRSPKARGEALNRRPYTGEGKERV
ncbi:MAG: hypothetical protein WAN62_20310, partial [Candidatus Acidiferrum sp.]